MLPISTLVHLLEPSAWAPCASSVASPDKFQDGNLCMHRWAGCITHESNYGNPKGSRKQLEIHQQQIQSAPAADEFAPLTQGAFQ